MPALHRDHEIVEAVLRKAAEQYPSGSNRTISAFDRNNGQFVLLREGWNGYRRIHYAWIHIEYRDGKFWIQRDGTEEGIANDLLALGIPKERIVLAFQHRIRMKRNMNLGDVSGATLAGDTYEYKSPTWYRI